jgi:choline dehydrogenase
MVRCPHVMTDAFVAAAQQAGLGYNADYNDGDQLGVSYAQVSQRRGLRASTARTYLAPAAHRRNLSVRTGAVVERIVTLNGRAVGVRYVRRGETITVYAEREVILSAGAIATPKLLMLSGIGPAGMLRGSGIDVVADVEAVGANLQEHPFATVRAVVSTPTLNTDVGPLRLARHAIDLVVHGSGAATAPLSHAIAFGKSGGDRPWSDYELMFSPFGVIGGGKEQTKYLPTTVNVSEDVNDMRRMGVPAIRIAVGVLHPHSRGRVSLRSADPGQPPRIEHTLLSDRRDVDALIEAVRRAREIIGAQAFAPHVVEEHAPGSDCRSQEQLEQFVRSTASRGQHPIGTCRMGSDALSVVDLSLRVRGVDGLRVVDASVMPSLTSGNTNAPVIAVAERAADLIRAT